MASVSPQPLPEVHDLRQAVQCAIKSNRDMGYIPRYFIQATERHGESTGQRGDVRQSGRLSPIQLGKL